MGAGASLASSAPGRPAGRGAMPPPRAAGSGVQAGIERAAFAAGAAPGTSGPQARLRGVRRARAASGGCLARRRAGRFSSSCTCGPCAPSRLLGGLPRRLLAFLWFWGAELWSLICYLICFLKFFSESLNDRRGVGSGAGGAGV